MTSDTRSSIIDTHTHFYGPDFQSDYSETLPRCYEAGVRHAILPSVNATSIPLMDEAVAVDPRFFKRMIGQHPTEMPEDWEEDLQLLKSELCANPDRYVGIGEIGLDYYWSQERKEEMNRAFRIQLEWALERELPVSIHARTATLDAVSAVREVGGDHITGVFHSFTEGEEALLAVLELPGFCVGVNGVFTFKKSPLPELYKKHLPLDRIVLETDAPYLAPTPHRGKRNDPSYLPLVLKYISEVYERPIEEVAEVILDNTYRTFPLLVCQ